MKNKKFIGIIFAGVSIAAILTIAVLSAATQLQKKYATQTVAVRSVGQAIVGQGEIHSAREAVLHFQTGGKLVYLPFQEGESVYAGQTIAQLDTYPIQKQLEQALNTYRSTRDTFDQTQQNVQDNLLQGQQRFVLETQNKVGITAGDYENTIIADMAKRIVDQNQANLDNAVINVEVANYALQLASLQAPFNGTIMHEDVDTANQNITPATSFSLADPTQLVFRSVISVQDIDFVSVGSPATISLTGSGDKIIGTVTKIYPQTVTTAVGEQMYQVDVAADGLTNAKLGQKGIVSIVSTNTKSTTVVPTWTIIDHQYIWVLEKNKPVLQKVSVGPSHNDATEVYEGLRSGDMIITNPKSIAASTNIAL